MEMPIYLGSVKFRVKKTLKKRMGASDWLRMVGVGRKGQMREVYREGTDGTR